MRNTFSDYVYELAKKNNKIKIIAADISPSGKLAELQKKYPEKIVNVGVAETSMISLCAGLAVSGYLPFAYTIATFSIFRPFEMIRVDLCYQNLPVTIVGMGGGTVYSTLGATHMAQEDISVMRSLPNMKILCPLDSLELKSCLNYIVSKPRGPVYLRIGKSGEKNFTQKTNNKWKFGKIRKIVNGKKICLIGYGPLMKIFFDILAKLKKGGINPSIYSCHTMKPFDADGLNKIFKKYKKIITLEDHSEIGGLGSIVKKNAFENKFKGKISSFSLKDQYIKCYGSQDDLLKKHGISKQKIIKEIVS
jgi:transketolase